MLILLCFIVSFVLGYYTLLQIIDFATKRKLVDIPDKRKVHTNFIPALGGVAIWIVLLISTVFYFDELNHKILTLLLFTSFIVLLGIVDDIKPQKASLKLLLQIIFSVLIIYFGDYRIDSLFGTFGINLLPYWLSILFSLFIFILFINALNLIDGINGLASLLGIIIFSFFGIYHYYFGNSSFVFISISIIGSLISFLRFNIVNPKIFMGDTGSTLIGFVACCFMMDYLSKDRIQNLNTLNISPYGIMLALFMFPIFDTFRVAFLRLLKQKSPFSPDKTHIHHIFLRFDLYHYKISLILFSINLFVLLFSIFFQHLGDTIIVTFILGSFVFLFFILEFLIVKKFKKRQLNVPTIEKLKNIVSEYWYLFYSVVAYVLPFQRWSTSIPLLVFSSFWIFYFKKNSFTNRKFNFSLVLFSSILFFVPLIYYLLYNFNTLALGTKLPLNLIFVIFPILIFFQKTDFVDKKWYFILSFYLLGILSFFSIVIAINIMKYFSIDNFNFTQNFVLLSKIPNIYFSLMLNFAIIVCYYLNRSTILLFHKPFFTFIVIQFLSFNIFFISSKIGFIIMIIILCFIFITNFIRNKKIHIVFYNLILNLIIFFIFFFSKFKLNIDYITKSSFEVSKRIDIWEHSCKMILQKPLLGYGDQYLNLLYKVSNNTINCHNQYIEYFLEYGILGFVLYILFLLFLMIIAFYTKDNFYKSFILLIICYSFFESIFTNQTGIVFFSLFNTLFLLKTKTFFLSNKNQIL